MIPAGAYGTKASRPELVFALKVENQPSTTMGRKRKRRRTRFTYAEIEEIRAFLGPIAAQYDDGQIARLGKEMYALANLLLDIYEYRRREREGPPETPSG